MKKILFLLLIVAGLFFSSGQTYEEQTLIPSLAEWLPDKPLLEPLSKLEIPYWGKIISVEERGYYPFVEFLLRKSAHFFLFGLLATAVYAVLPRFTLRSIIALVITLGLAIADEYHQSLTGGRTPSSRDVLLDTAGAITFIAVLRIVLVARGGRKRKRRGKL
ncbi:VanZ family protein [Filibacter tadaridae]|uniref:VanZ like family protein n=1 Tax=Filibacter tadaridae TaxID=2483811 RepID=A0A3P5XWX4_9BACL|nr:VanZ family protein [Filibacter tadaridae]VDC33678.1 VanZ like family protein [Filibacter tadaridae]